MTKTELKLTTNINIHNVIESRVRGGLYYIAKIYGRANNKYKKDYNKNKESKYIIEFDVNNLYGSG